MATGKQECPIRRRMMAGEVVPAIVSGRRG
jgi:hypothetical protein